jgi:hypothetical protein
LCLMSGVTMLLLVDYLCVVTNVIKMISLSVPALSL